MREQSSFFGEFAMRSIIGAAVVALTLSGCGGDLSLAWSAYNGLDTMLQGGDAISGSWQSQQPDTTCARMAGCVRSAALVQE